MKHALAVGAFLAIFAVFALLARDQVFPWPYYYDEADYMFAAAQGWQANWADRRSESLAEFVRIGLRDGHDSSKRAELSAESRGSSDVNFYRHWHGPLYFYWLRALAPLHLGERATRAWSYVFPVVTGFLIFFGCLWLLRGVEATLAAVLSTTFYLWSYATVFTNELAPHQLFVLCTVASLLLLMKWRATGATRYWYGAVMVAACAFCTLEVALVLVVVLIACAGKRQSLKAIFLFFGTVLALWPSGLIKLSFVKAYLFMGYLAIFRKSPWGDAGFLETWRLRFTQSPAEWILLALAAIVYFCFCDYHTRCALAPVVLYGALMLMALLRVNSETPRYLLPFLAAFQLAAGMTFASVLKGWKSEARFAAAASICVLLLWNTYAQVRAHPILSAPRLADVLAKVRVEKLEGKKLLAPQNDVPMLHYYVPGIVLSGYVNEQERSEFLSRSDFDAVLYAGYPVNLQRQSSGLAHYFSQR
jgi:hypothetical protein